MLRLGSGVCPMIRQPRDTGEMTMRAEGLASCGGISTVLSYSALVCGLAGSAGAAPTEYKDAVDNAEPMLWFSFDEASGNLANKGSLGSGFDAVQFGTVGRSQASPGSDTGIRFDPNGYFETIGISPLTGNPTFSIELVVLLDNATAGNYGTFLHWGDGPAPRSGREVYFSIANNDNLRPFAGFYNGGTRATEQVAIGRWHHIVWTRTGGTDSNAGSTLYVDGLEVELEQDPTLSPGFFSAMDLNISASEFRINEARDFFTSRFIRGVIDELALYDRVLTDSEIVDRAGKFTCGIDFNNDGVLNNTDINAFVTLFLASDAAADLSGDGSWNNTDINLFVQQFLNPCD